MDDVSSGRLKIPQFQREFVWEIKKSASLLDSVVKGYPVGSFIFWKTRERLRSVKNIGNLNLPEPAKGDYVNFVLDGQQRITSLFATLKGEKIIRDNGKEEDFSEIFIDLEAEEEWQNCNGRGKVTENVYFLSIHQITKSRQLCSFTF